MNDEDFELFENCFHEWLTAHGVEIAAFAGLFGGKFECKVDFNELKIAIARLIRYREVDARPRTRQIGHSRLLQEP